MSTVKKTGVLKAEISATLRQRDGKVIDLGVITSDHGRIRNWFFKKNKEREIWKLRKPELRASEAFPHRTFLGWQLRREDGAIAFLDNGKQWIVDVADGATRAAQTDMKFIGWGTGAGTTAEADTTLFTEASEARVTGTMSQVTTTVAGDTYQVIGTLTANAGKNITNAGVADALTGGRFLIKGDHASVPLLLNDQIEYTFKLHVDQ